MRFTLISVAALLLVISTVCATKELSDAYDFGFRTVEKVAQQAAQRNTKEAQRALTLANHAARMEGMFKPLSAESPASCTGYHTALLGWVSKCQAPLSSLSSGTAPTPQQIQAICALNCGTEIANIFTQYGSCMEGSTIDKDAVTKAFNAICTTDPSDGQNCLSKISGLTSILSGVSKSISCTSSDMVYDRTACSASALCKWDSTKYMCEFDASKLTQVCALRECFLTLVADMDSSTVDPEAVNAAFDLMCSAHQGTMCFPVMAKLASMQSPEDICTNAVTQGCVGKLLPQAQKMAKKSAYDSFYRCVVQANNYTETVTDCCMPTWESQYKNVMTLEQNLRLLCTKNAQGQLCTSVVRQLDEGRVDECGEAAVRNKTCLPGCDATLVGVVSTMGCCLGTFLTASGNVVVIPSTAYPKYTAVPCTSNCNRWTCSHSSTSPTQGLDNLSVCPTVATMLPQVLAGSCPLPTFPVPGSAAPTPQPTVDPCQSAAYTSLLSSMEGSCQPSLWPNLTTASVATVTQIMSGVCAVKCSNTLKTLTSTYSQCMETDTKNKITTILAGCNKSPDGRYCMSVGATLFNLGRCSTLTSAADCIRDADCSWGKDRCYLAPKQTTITGVCNNDCVPQLYRTMSPKSSSEVAFTYQMLCTKVNDQFCFTSAVHTINTYGVGGFTNATLSGMCGSNATERRCLSAIAVMNSGLARNSANKVLQSCISSTRTSSGRRLCVANWATRMWDAAKVEAMYTNLCVKNPAGKYCNALWTAMYQLGSTCFMDNNMGTCSQSCSTQTKQLSDNAGCCVGQWHLNLGGGASFADKLPANLRYLGADLAVVSGPMTAGLMMATSCRDFTPGQLMNMSLSKCPRKVPPRKIAKVLALKLAYNKLAADPSLKSRLIAALIKDVASALAISPSSIVNADIVVDPRVTVEIDGSSSAHRMSTLAVVYGSKFVFEIAAEEASVSENAAVSFDSLSNSGKMTLPSTNALVQNDCPACVDSNAPNLEPVNPAPPAPEDSSSGMNVGIIAGAVAGAVLVVALGVVAIARRGKSSTAGNSMTDDSSIQMTSAASV